MFFSLLLQHSFKTYCHWDHQCYWWAEHPLVSCHRDHLWTLSPATTTLPHKPKTTGEHLVHFSFITLLAGSVFIGQLFALLNLAKYFSTVYLCKIKKYAGSGKKKYNLECYLLWRNVSLFNMIVWRILLLNVKLNSCHFSLSSLKNVPHKGSMTDWVKHIFENKQYLVVKAKSYNQNIKKESNWGWSGFPK